jgi:hypothetical protein
MGDVADLQQAEVGEDAEPALDEGEEAGHEEARQQRPAADPAGIDEQLPVERAVGQDERPPLEEAVAEASAK